MFYSQHFLYFYLIVLRCFKRVALNYLDVPSFEPNSSYLTQTHHHFYHQRDWLPDLLMRRMKSILIITSAYTDHDIMN